MGPTERLRSVLPEFAGSRVAAEAFPKGGEAGEGGLEGQATICSCLGRCLDTSVPCILAKGRVFSAGSNDFITCLCLWRGGSDF